MKLAFSLPLGVALCMISPSAPRAQDNQNNASAEKNVPANQSSGPKLIRAPIVPASDEAIRKNIEGTVALQIVIDAKGKVIDSKPLSGPPELFETAVASTKQWQFERPGSAPAVATVEVRYGHPHECPGPISDSREVRWGGWYKSPKGNVISADDRSMRKTLRFPYTEEDRKAGVAGVLILSVSVDRKGRVRDLRVAKGLSPDLDESASTQVRKWRFRLVSDKGGGFPDQFLVPITFTPTCSPFN